MPRSPHAYAFYADFARESQAQGAVQAPAGEEQLQGVHPDSKRIIQGV